MTPYTPIEHLKSSFNCPHCYAYSEHKWSAAEKFDLRAIKGGSRIPGGHINDLEFSQCSHCKKHTVWIKNENRMVYPNPSFVSLPNKDLPEDIQKDYLEAREIVESSPRGATALLRLCIQKLCKHMGEKGNNINDDIANLVKKGLPELMQQALDSVRVIGNNAVHPGVIDLTDNKEIAYRLFEIINIAATSLITQPKQITDLYSNVIPKSQQDAINKRDNKV